jgi:phosphoglycerol transferase MdoB-like AlkP superfamily enzyme
MNDIWKRIRSYYNAALHPFFWHALLALVLYGAYRVRVYRYIQSMYPDMQLRSFWEYSSLSLHYDSITIFFTLAALALLIIVMGGFPRVKYFVLASLSIIFIFFIYFSMEFFRVYETTFQKNYAGREHFTDLASILDSALAEFSVEFYILFFLFSAMAIVMNIALCRREMNIDDNEIRGSCSGGSPSKHMLVLPPGLLILFLLISLATAPSVPAEKFAPRYKIERDRKLSMLHEFSMNPVYNLCSWSTGGTSGETYPGLTGSAPFTHRLNTDSLASDRRYSPQDIIPRNRPYNIILYFFESTPNRYYDIKINGRYVIETWHRLEQNSLNFRNHYANYPLSANALLSVLTSAYDLDSKDMVIQKYPDIRLRSLPEILKDRGYRTCLIHTGGLGYAGQKRFLINRKIDEIIEYNQLIKIPPYNRQVGWGIDERAMIQPAVQFIKKSPGKPFLLVFLPVNPHHPYAIPDDTFRIIGEGREESDYRKRNWYNYLNSLHYADASLGMLVDELERENLMDNTLLFIFADHGEAFYQHKMNYNHPLFIYNENVQVPFKIYNKKLFQRPEYFDGITRHIDILPTILDLLGIKPAPEQEGIPLLSRRREQLALLHTSWKDDYMGIADGRWKYIWRAKDMLEELYDLVDDPGETDNIAAKHPDVTARYRRFVMKARNHKSEYYKRLLNNKK